MHQPNLGAVFWLNRMAPAGLVAIDHRWVIGAEKTSALKTTDHRLDKQDLDKMYPLVIMASWKIRELYKWRFYSWKNI